MKSLEELRVIKERAAQRMGMREAGGDSIRVVVGMATCGIAAGARPVLQAFTEECHKRSLHNVVVTQTGCIGICQYEPVVEVLAPGKEKITYVKVNPEKVAQIVASHIVNGNPVVEYTIGASAKE